MSDGTMLLIPAPPPEPTRRRRSPFAAVVSGLVALQLLAAVAALAVHGGGRDVVSIDSFAAIADDTAAVRSLRFDCVMTLHGPGVPAQAIEMIRGEQAGPRGHFLFDGAALLAAVGGPSGVAADDAVIEMYTDETQLLVRAPLFSSGVMAGAAPAAVGPLADLGTRWGRADLTATGLDPERVAALAGSQGLSFDSTLQLLRDAGSAPVPAGQGEVHGTPVDLYHSTITMTQMLEAEGQDPDRILAMLPPDAGVDLDGVLDAMLGLPLDLTVAVDDQGRLRSLAFRFGSDDIAGVAEQLGATGGEVAELRSADFGLEIAFELYALDDPSITVEVPVVTDAVDLTDWARSLGG